MREALASARAGAGRLIEIVGEAGVGKTRLLEALRDEATGFPQAPRVLRGLHRVDAVRACGASSCASYMDFGRDDPEDVIVERLSSEVATRAPDLTPWLPLIAIALDLDVAPTPEVELLAEANRRANIAQVRTPLPRSHDARSGSSSRSRTRTTWTRPRPSSSRTSPKGSTAGRG